MNIALAVTLLIFFSALAFWQRSAVLFLLTAGLSLLLGLQWYDLYGNPLGLTMSLALIAYAIMCLTVAFRCLFMAKPKEEEITEE